MTVKCKCPLNWKIKVFDIDFSIYVYNFIFTQSFRKFFFNRFNTVMFCYNIASIFFFIKNLFCLLDG